MAVNSLKQTQNMPSSTSALQVGSKASTDVKKSEAAQATKSVANAYAKASQPPAQQAAANVQISPRARELNLARQVVESTPDVREDKVAKFKSMIERGEYKPDAGKIADSILSEAIRDELSKDAEVALT
jgi:flagellar biosynthesis anti-sigma factor FlgM